MIFFHSWYDFILMGGLGIYVWGSYFVCVGGLIVYLCIVFFQRNQALKKIRIKRLDDEAL